MERWQDLLARLARGGFGYFWVKCLNGSSSTIWWRPDQIPEIPSVEANIYFGVNPSKARRERTDRATIADIAQVNCLYAEFDAKDFDTDKNKALQHVQSLPLAPNVLIDSGGGYHAYWTLADGVKISDDKERRRIADIQARWVKFVRGDKAVFDLARVLRVPGTYNYKYAPVREVLFIECDLDMPYYLEDLLAVLPKVEPTNAPLQQPAPVIIRTSSKPESLAIWINKALAREQNHMDPSQGHSAIWLGAQLRDDGFSQLDAEDAIFEFIRKIPQLDPEHPWTNADATRMARTIYRRPAREPARNLSRTEPIHANGNGHKPSQTTGQAAVAEMSEIEEEMHSPAQTQEQLQPPEEPPVPADWTPVQPAGPVVDDLPELEYLPFETVREALNNQEMGDADLLATLYKQRVIFDHSDKSWYNWSGNHWKLDATRSVYRMFSRRVAPQFFHAAGEAEAKGLTDVAKKMAERAAGLRNKKRLDNVLFLAGGHEDLALVGDEWDTNHMLLGCSNGVIDLRTGDFRPGKPKDYIRNISQVEWQGLDATQCPNWLRFISSIFGDDMEMVAFMQRLLGYAITGLTSEHIFPILWGEEGSNGKTTMMETLGDVLGNELATSSQADALMEASRGGSGDSPKPFVFALRGKRLAWAIESNEGRRINEGLVKQLTGDDRITVRTLHSKPVSFKPTHKLFLVTNHRPHIAADGSAIWRRVLLIPFVEHFAENPQGRQRQRDSFLREKLLAELPGILAWLVMGCLEWQEIGLRAPKSVMAATADYREDEDTIALFIGEKLQVGENRSIRSSELYKAYHDWCKEFGFDAMSLTAFSTRMKARFKWKHTERGNYFDGLDLSKEIPF